MPRCSLFLLVVAVAFSARAQQALPGRPAQLGLCAACHGATGIAVAKGIPDLAGQDADYLAAALTQYRKGERSNSAMRAAAGALTSEDIDALAHWYSAQPRCPGNAQ